MNPSPVTQFIDALRPAFETGDEAAANKTAEASCVMHVQELYRAISRGDIAAFLEGLDEHVEMENVGPSALPFVGRWSGRAEVAEAVRRNFSWMEDQRPEVLTVVAQGDTVVIVAREQGRFRPTGRTYDVNWVQQFTVRGGRLVRFRQVFDSAGLLDAVAGWEPTRSAE